MTGQARAEPLLSPEAVQRLHDATELDYMTQIENCLAAQIR